ncbi:hypothetical protein C1H46_020768 [Malus baccata]|uniref:Uncharacterized protein n=1 Tax=Malus baccata TaxID=106549 RepID=A0A540M4D6_MALBA|nr:hypothetical protein C1H46_020768 [Malus baccata]
MMVVGHISPKMAVHSNPLSMAVVSLSFISIGELDFSSVDFPLIAHCFLPICTRFSLAPNPQILNPNYNFIHTLSIVLCRFLFTLQPGPTDSHLLSNWLLSVEYSNELLRLLLPTPSANCRSFSWRCVKPRHWFQRGALPRLLLWLWIHVVIFWR